ncbi:MAG: aldehyde dehydrogenase family protein [Ignavibacteria bacterium]|nr:aldehyde dehydrogenase family protein [Ignavibacteria bacterium]
MRKFILDINPATWEVIEKIKCSSPGEVASGVKLARKAFKIWSKTPIKRELHCLKIFPEIFSKKKKKSGN